MPRCSRSPCRWRTTSRRWRSRRRIPTAPSWPERPRSPFPSWCCSASSSASSPRPTSALPSRAERTIGTAPVNVVSATGHPNPHRPTERQDMFSGASFPLGPFTPYEGNPILRPRGDSWESANLYNPAALVDGDEVLLLYRAHADDIVSHIGLARSRDGVNFTREDEPILSPVEDYERYGCEDPRIARIDGTYYLTYTGWDRHSAQLCLA